MSPPASPDGRTLCWISMERDGYEADRQRLMAADIVSASETGEASDTGAGIKAVNIRELTAGFKYNAAGPVWSPDSRYIYFNALAEGIQGIFRASAAGAGGNSGIERITGEDLWYDFGSPFHIYCKDGKTVLLADYCSMDFPTELAEITIGKEPDEEAEVRHCTVLKSECAQIGTPQ